MRVEKLEQKLNLDGHLGLFLLRIVSVMFMKLSFLLYIVHCLCMNLPAYSNARLISKFIKTGSEVTSGYAR